MIVAAERAHGGETDHPAVRNGIDCHHLALGVLVELVSDDHICGQDELHTCRKSEDMSQQPELGSSCPPSKSKGHSS